jgi:hypothetical protein
MPIPLKTRWRRLWIGIWGDKGKAVKRRQKTESSRQKAVGRKQKKQDKGSSFYEDVLVYYRKG